ncbi:hypothetical protein [Virgibacillus salinus]|uniref:Uncharacterized protein n=1 Tax=Virgibacillus salinus TaxID=553311 RepID=A0A1H0XV14_9BACI|nr:hypothetical protein [Virgibacillus salinus]SDQ06757.1 hypothetical protein SAMN05216231_0230 [Virgibacillus salinus]
MNPITKELPDLDSFVGSNCTDTKRTSGTGGLTIVYSQNGKRLSLNSTILDHLTDQSSVQIAYTETYMAIANFIAEINTNYTLGKNGKSGVIYNAALVKEIIGRYHLDFTNRTSITFPIFEVQEIEGEKVIYIKMKPNDNILQG